MRYRLLATAALLGLAAFVQPAFAQNTTGSSQTPPATGAGSQMPQPANSLPAGASNAAQAAPGNAVGTTGGMPGAVVAAPRPMRPRAGYARPYGRAPMEAAAPAVDDGSSPPTSAYRGGVGSPLSTQATNLAPSRSAMGSRLPDPNAVGDTPQSLLAAAQRALNQGRTGAAQEALERAETRVLSRTTDPSLAGMPDEATMVRNLAAARQALGRRDIAGAKAAIQTALNAPIPPRGPAVTTTPAYAPYPAPMVGQPPMAPIRAY